MNLFVVQGVTKVPLGEIARGIWPFIATMTVFLILVIVFPQIALFIPYSMK